MALAWWSPARALGLLAAAAVAALVMLAWMASPAAASHNDYDSDDDGLIDITNMAQLNAIRWDMNADGKVDLNFPQWHSWFGSAWPHAESGFGCNEDETNSDDQKCIGYELMNDLTFDSNGSGHVSAADHGGKYWNAGKGWLPMQQDFRYDSYTAIFEGNGHTIDYFYIHVDGSGTNTGCGYCARYFGLFDTLDSSGVMRNVGFGNVYIRLKSNTDWNSGNVSRTQRYYGGVIAGSIKGTVENVWVEGTIEVNGDSDHGGALAGIMDGGTISNTFSTATVKGGDDGSGAAGGLAGGFKNGTVSNVYVTGATGGDGDVMGGLAGFINGTTVNNALALGSVTAGTNTDDVGGMFGTSTNPTISNSYWDKQTTGQNTSAGSSNSVGKTTAQVQGPTSNSGIYSSWPAGNWDFGSSSQYPQLRSDFNGDGHALTYEFGPQRANVSPTVANAIPDQLALHGTDTLPLEPSGALIFGDANTGDVFTYSATSSKPSDISVSVSGTTLTITITKATTANITVTATDLGGATGSDTFEITPATDYDTDGDQLMEIKTLAQLNAIRWNMDGDETVEDSTNVSSFRTAFPNLPTIGNWCDGGCGGGYELRADLDFDTNDSGTADSGDTYWNNGKGWTPLGGITDGDLTSFSDTFDGNGHKISNLYINNTNYSPGITHYFGLFGGFGREAVVKNLGLVDVDLTTSSSSSARSRVGALAGFNIGDVENVYVTGTVTSNGPSDKAGGLLGINASTISSDPASLTKAYARVDVSATAASGEAGGLAGLNLGHASISDAYSVGSVTTGNASSNRAGGLVGRSTGLNSSPVATAFVEDSYSHAVVIPAATAGLRRPVDNATCVSVSPTATISANVGGLIGQVNSKASTTTSYWNTETSGHSTSAGGTGVVGKTTSELRTPTSNTGIYSGWSSSNWDFGTGTDYPLLKVDFNGDNTATSAEFGDQRLNCSPTLLRSITDTAIIPGTTTVSVDLESTGDHVFFDADGEDLTYTATSSNTDNVTVAVSGSTVTATKVKSASEADITVTASDGNSDSDTVSTTYNVVVQVDYDTDDDGLIEVTNLAQFNALRWDLDGDGVADNATDKNDYFTQYPYPAVNSGCPSTGCDGYELTADLDFDTNDNDTADSGDTYWNSGAGWTPIGGEYDATFEGNGHTISNLHINTTSSITTGADYYGLFSTLGSDAKVQNFGLENVDVSASSSGAGATHAGAVAGKSEGEINNVYVNGTVSANGNSDVAGGLVGLSTGTDAAVSVAYARAEVSATGTSGTAGGLVAISAAGASIDDAYTVGLVSTGTATGNTAGGIVGKLQGTSSITDSHSYAVVKPTTVTGVQRPLTGNTCVTVAATTNSASTGGLAGTAATNATLSNSYWDTEITGQTASAGSAATAGKTTSDLRTPTSNTGIFANWSSTNWDFGTGTDYPLLKVDFDGNNTATTTEFGDQTFSCGPLLLNPLGTQGIIPGDSTVTVELETTGSLVFLDPDGDVITYTAVSGTTANVTVAVSGSTITATKVKESSSSEITLTASDGESDTDDATTKFTVVVQVDYDTDDDKLIEITTLRHLNAIRFDMNGDGYGDTDHRDTVYEAWYPHRAVNSGCPSPGCEGYELSNDLDFDTNGNGKHDSGDLYGGGQLGDGMSAIGSAFNTEFNATFEGNGHTISNHYWEATTSLSSGANYYGLFASLGTGAKVQNVGLVNSQVDTSSSGAGETFVGLLAGQNKGTITNVYASGKAKANGNKDRAGGLVGRNTGSSADISVAYARAEVSATGANGIAGGLVAINTAGASISDAYAVGSVTTGTASGNTAGGLVGSHQGTSSIDDSYTSAAVIPTTTAGLSRPVTGTECVVVPPTTNSATVGGLVGTAAATATVTTSYWDTESTGHATSAGSAATAGKTTSQMWTPTSATGIYADWATGTWDFGTNEQYPTLKSDFDNNNTATSTEFGDQFFSCGPVVVNAIPDQAIVVPHATTVTVELETSGSPVFFDPEGDDMTYTVTSSNTANVTVAISGSTITATKVKNASEADITVTASDGDSDTADTSDTFTVRVQHDYDLDNDNLIEVDNLADLNVIRYDLDGDGAADNDSDSTKYAVQYPYPAADSGCPSGCDGYELTAALDFDTNSNGQADNGDTYWNSGAGWAPIGGVYNATFDAKRHPISNLYIDRSSSASKSYYGLFAQVGSGGALKNIRLDGVSITAGSSGQNASAYAGALAGQNQGSLSSCSAEGSITIGPNDTAGGVVGENKGNSAGIVGCFAAVDLINSGSHGQRYMGGLVGENTGVIDTSYATGNISRPDVTLLANIVAGGLVGESRGAGSVIDTYATGPVSVKSGSAGGLLGHGTSTDSFAIGSLSVIPGSTQFWGGLSGFATGTVVDSYWDSETTGDTTGIFGTHKTTSELQTPTSNTGIYANWSANAWNFGKNSQYPALLYDFNGDGTTTWQEFGRQRPDSWPKVANPVPKQIVAVNATLTIDLEPTGGADVFSDREGAAMTYTVVSSDTAKGTVTLDQTAKTITISGVAAGTTQITLTATDDESLWGTHTFTTIVAPKGDIPTVTAITDKTALVESSLTVTLTGTGGAFSDPNSDTLTVTATSDDTDLATVSVNNTTGVLTVNTQRKAGTATIDLEATDPSGYFVRDSFTVTSSYVDHDVDDDGLIEVANLTQLNAIRFDLNGDGVIGILADDAAYRLAWPRAGPDMGCPSTGCDGYELTADLDLDTNGNGQADNGDTYWNSGAGWTPIGDTFSGVFDGKHHTIANLHINATGTPTHTNHGLFGEIGVDGEVRNVSLVNASVTVAASNAVNVGAVAGVNKGSVSACAATGSVTSNTTATDIGGLVGKNDGSAATITGCYADVTVSVSRTASAVGGLVGHNVNGATITNSYAQGAVSSSGSANLGGLVGASKGSTITDSYATGSASLPNSSGSVGGLVGAVSTSKGVSKSFSAGLVTPYVGFNSYGGLVGLVSDTNSVQIQHSYWDSTTSGTTVGTHGTAKTTTELETPTANTGIYANWSATAWNYGKNLQYPALSYDFNGDGTATWQEFGRQRPASWPKVANPVAKQQVAVGSTVTVDLEPSDGADVFSDREGSAMTYTAASGDTTKATVTVNQTAKTVTITGVATGVVEITLTATDDESLWGTHTFTTVVASSADIPTVTAIPDKTALVESSLTVTLTGTGGAFSDPNGDTLTITATSDNTDVATVAVDSTTGVLTVTTYRLAGTATIDLEAKDPTEYFVRDSFTVTSSYVDHDDDDNGLIEFSTLAQLNAIRLDLNGDGEIDNASDDAAYRLAWPKAGPDMGCPSTGCDGYELTADLDFDTNGNGRADNGDTYWNNGAGWDAIGGTYSGVFDGNHHTISNLHISRNRTSTEDSFGLFAKIGADGEVRNIRLDGVSITAGSSGNSTANAGALAGDNQGEISACSAQGSVNVSSNDNAGGVVGNNSTTGASITGCYADVAVTSSGMSSYSGGLAGKNSGTIDTSYAIGAVETITGFSHTGGLVAESTGTVTDSYATGSVTAVFGIAGSLLGGGASTDSFALGRLNVDPKKIQWWGGLTGVAAANSVEDSYWDSETTGDTSGIFGVHKTTSELQSPTTNTGIYANWSASTWNFGKNTQYPALKYDFNGDGTATWQEFGRQRPDSWPTLVNPIPTHMVPVGTTVTIHLEPTGGDNVFHDREGSTMTYAAVSADATKATVAVNQSADTVSVTGVATGNVDIALTATDDESLWVNHTFIAIVAPTSDIPTVTAIADQAVLVESATPVALGGTGGAFSDPNGDKLTFAATSSNTDVATVSVNNATGVLTVNTKRPAGTTTISVRGTDPSGYFVDDSFDVTSSYMDHDVDNDGLIDVGTVAALNSIRYDLNGDGVIGNLSDDAAYRAGLPRAGPDMGCPAAGCTGYELVADLDFDTNGNGQADSGDAFWNNGAGWTPIGGGYPAVFDGQHHTIANLYINASGTPSHTNHGLFGWIEGDGTVRNVSLVDASVTVSATNAVNIGALAGLNEGTMSACSATGTVTSSNTATDVGGLVGKNDGAKASIAGCFADVTVSVSGTASNAGGLLGHNADGAALTTSYAQGAVSGSTSVNLGGLVGTTDASTVSDTYATGAAGLPTSPGSVGGLVGSVTTSKGVYNSYATGLLTPNPGFNYYGGLVGIASGGAQVQHSYWDATTSGTTIGADGTHKTTAELQTPTANTGIYSHWNSGSDEWNFGISSQYPALKYDFDGDGTATWQEFGDQRPLSRPTLDNPISDQIVGTSSTINVVLERSGQEVFTDPEGGPLTYTVASDSPANVSVAVAQSPTAVAITGVTTGKANITVTATDNEGLSRSDEFEVLTAPQSEFPTVTNAIADQEVATTFSLSIPLEESGKAVFNEPSNGALTYTLDLSTSTPASVTIDTATKAIAITGLIQGKVDITVRATNASGYWVEDQFALDVTLKDYDTDDDGLLEIDDLVRLDAIRFDLDGDGVSTDPLYAQAFRAAEPGLGCPSFGCSGYELIADLDFDSDGDGDVDANDHDGDYWNAGQGWKPISGGFSGTLKGNGHVIRNLFISDDNSAETALKNTTGYYGLFSEIGGAGSVETLGLENASVTVKSSTDVGANRISSAVAGTLAGWNKGTVNSVYSSGNVSAGGDSDMAGGLVGYNTGNLEITYSTGTVYGEAEAGGLAGRTRTKKITNSYTTATVNGAGVYGGLTGWLIDADLEDTYAAGTILGSVQNNGLIYDRDAARQATVTDSYWDKDVTGRIYSTSVNASKAKTTAELQSPTSATGIYGNWDDRVWHFAPDDRYPVLVTDFNADGTATWWEFGDQRVNRAPVRPRGVGHIELGFNSSWQRDFDEAGNEIFIEPDDEALTYTLENSDPSVATVTLSQSDLVVQANTHAKPGTTWVTVIVTDVQGAQAEVEFTVSSGTDYDTDNDHLIEVSNLAQLNAIRWDVNGDGYVADADQAAYSSAFPQHYPAMGCKDRKCRGYELTADLDFDTNSNGRADAGDAYWNNGRGWDPIPGEFWATFRGNDHTISNLYIRDDQSHLTAAGNTTSRYGLFEKVIGKYRNPKDSRTWVQGKVERLGVINADIQVASSRDNGSGAVSRSYVGIIAGENYAAYIDNTWVSGRVAADGDSDSVGGIVGYNNTSGTIHGSFAEVVVSAQGADSYAGGITGRQNGGLQRVYVRGVVDGAGAAVGGIAGSNHKPMDSGMSTARVIGGADTAAGGLFGTNSYNTRYVRGVWDTETSGQPTSAAGSGHTTAELQQPTNANNNLYSAVNFETYIWDFGSSNEYPVFRATKWFTHPVDTDDQISRSLVYDTDSNGLIEISSLAQLNALRWDRDGNGTPDDPDWADEYAAAYPDAMINMGCPASGCVGYELTTDLDFDTNNNNQADDGDQYWNNGGGWAPISSYRGVLDGKGHSISNLYIRSGSHTNGDRAGLFRRLTDGGHITNLALLDVDIWARATVGSFAGLVTRATISNSYATGVVELDGSGDAAGGLVGEASGHPNGRDTLINTYSRVTVRGLTSSSKVGGLVGSLHVNQSRYSRVTNSYAAGLVQSTGDSPVGGLAARNGHGRTRISDSYWDVNATNQSTSANDNDGHDDDGKGKSTSELKSPTGANGIYANWDANVWDFGSSGEYPVLKYDTDNNGTATWQEFGSQSRS
ncbi:GLUG motif-containing protein [Candidatus Poriferisocius sp.]|uniref:GLUG motif-containing protein n=1 Tax=Candidatus Poriferisocius sp. TaxID=3101276 RepID=UPI003B59E6DF